MYNSSQLLIFTIDQRRYALRLAQVVMAVRVVEFTPAPRTSEILIGVVNLQGEVVPVFNCRKRLQMPEREIELSDHLLIAQTNQQMVALVVDEVQSLVAYEEEIIGSSKVFACLDYVEAVAKLADGTVLILDLDKFVSASDEQKEALKQTFPREEVAHC